MSEDLVGKQVVDPHGYNVGKIDGVYGREGGERACWALVKTGPLSRAFIPLHDAQDQEGDVRIVYEKEHVKAAPDVEVDGDELDDDDAEILHRHYGLERITAITVNDDDDGPELPRETREAKPPDMGDLPPASERHPIP